MAERMMAERATGDTGEAKNPHKTRDELVLENLKYLVADNLEIDWRFYKSQGLMPMRKKNEAVGFSPAYCPCPAPVKIDKNGDWSPANTKRCKKQPPGNMSGKEQRVWAYVHMMEAHVPWWIEVNSLKDDPQRDGETRPPKHTNARLPYWQDIDDPNAERALEMTEFERAVEKQKASYNNSLRKQDVMNNARAAKKKAKDKERADFVDEKMVETPEQTMVEKEEEGES